ncbi:MAG TPA: bifunctional 2-polyprenyl-6-hydroxyphenol methylase/3-demethylubiquinol 3-O-methyltransferase UbiG [Chloroflexia bacterium]|nr:bifunctional 2-polyprenyl-6-hydroxyphenol methylase/3-demethylubiquinol 3-O-methyltransferase UbiG [Chloroflexia bacterium]
MIAKKTIETRMFSGTTKGFQTWYDRVGDKWLANAPTVLNEETPVRLEYINRMVGPVAGLKFLDLGLGGMGTLSNSLARQGADIIAIDQHDQTLKLAETEAKRAALPVDFQIANFKNLPFPDNFFDLVYGFDILEHAGPDMDSWLQEICRVLKPGGSFIYNMPNRTPISFIMIIIIFERVIKLNPVGHHNFKWFWKPAQFRAILERNGLLSRDQTGFMNLKPKLIAGLNVLTRQGAPGGFKLGRDFSLVYVGKADKSISPA